MHTMHAIHSRHQDLEACANGRTFAFVGTVPRCAQDMENKGTEIVIHVATQIIAIITYNIQYAKVVNKLNTGQV